jgi:hypothetical protein
MRLQHRRWHRVAWIVLPVIVAMLFVAALAVKPLPLSPGSGVIQGSRQ